MTQFTGKKLRNLLSWWEKFEYTSYPQSQALIKLKQSSY